MKKNWFCQLSEFATKGDWMHGVVDATIKSCLVLTLVGRNYKLFSSTLLNNPFETILTN